MIVDVYFNRTRKCWSLRHKGRVVDHACALTMVECSLRVGEMARQRVVATGKRGVHAWITGTPFSDRLEKSCRFAAITWEEIGYCPFRDSSFHIKATRQSVIAAHMVRFDADGRCFVARDDP